LEKQGKLIKVTPVYLSVPSRQSRRTPALWLRYVLCALLIAGHFEFASCLSAQQSKPEEYQVKAVYLYNFGRFVQWPAAGGNDDSFTICILGHDPFGAVLDTTLSGESIDNLKLVAKRISSPRDAAACHILFLSSSEAGHTKEALAHLEKSPVLTVSDLPGFTSSGGMIQFVLKENKVRFEVNLAAAEKAGLSFSSQLLKVATDIRK
jgi:YfiR/HmsC-like